MEERWCSQVEVVLQVDRLYGRRLQRMAYAYLTQRWPCDQQGIVRGEASRKEMNQEDAVRGQSRRRKMTCHQSRRRGAAVFSVHHIIT